LPDAGGGGFKRRMFNSFDGIPCRASTQARLAAPPPLSTPHTPRTPKLPPASFCFLLRTQVVLLNVQDDISKDAVNAALDRYLRRKMVLPHPPVPAHHPSLFIRFSTKRMK